MWRTLRSDAGYAAPCSVAVGTGVINPSLVSSVFRYLASKVCRAVIGMLCPDGTASGFGHDTRDAFKAFRPTRVFRSEAKGHG